jgi:hypothetical protein
LIIGIEGDNLDEELRISRRQRVEEGLETGEDVGFDMGNIPEGARAGFEFRDMLMEHLLRGL